MLNECENLQAARSTVLAAHCDAPGSKGHATSWTLLNWLTGQASADTVSCTRPTADSFVYLRVLPKAQLAFIVSNTENTCTSNIKRQGHMPLAHTA